MATKESKQLNLSIWGANICWLEFASALKGDSQTAYINRLLQEAREGASEREREAYNAFCKARGDEAYMLTGKPRDDD